MLRKSKENDCDIIYKLICDLENKQFEYKKFKSIYIKQLRDSHYYCLACELDGEIIGLLNLRFEEQLHHAETIAEILEFSILDEYRNRGIGKEMFERACLIAKIKGCLQIEVDCNNLRKNTHRFYLREGMYNSHYKFVKFLDSLNVKG